MTRHTYECRVRFSDVDVYGHVNNVKYFEYYQEARISFVGWLGSGDERGPAGVVLARMNVDYRRPILFRSEPYTVESWLSRVGGSSFTLSAEIKDGDTVLSRAEAVMVAFDARTQSARPLTDRERERLLSSLES